MEQESTFRVNINKRAAIIGAGPAGCVCAKVLSDSGLDVTIFDKGQFLRTILPTGGGRCNLAYAEFDFKNLAKNYPRGEKFLYSVFSRFGTADTLKFFNSIGIKTYIQNDNRIFPESNDAKEVRQKLLSSLKNSHFQKEEVKGIEKIESAYKLTTDKSTYVFEYVIVAAGGHAGYEFLKNLNIHIIEPTQALVGLNTKEDLSGISGVSIKGVKANGKEFKNLESEDIIFTHKGISGPLIYKISSIYARKEFPYKLNLRFTEQINLQEELNNNPHKEIKNLMGNYIPKSFAEWILKDLEIIPETTCCKINGTTRDKILNKLTCFEITITGKNPDGEIVTCGGVDLKEINSKTMESKKFPGLYFIGEVLDIDGFCGGFNLQNCWSTAYIAAESIIQTLIH